MPKFDITTQTRNLDAVIAGLDDPLHRRILTNYRNHAIHEICGYKERIFEPDMTVEHPVYWVNSAEVSLELDGLEQVLGFYQSLQDTEATVMVVTDEKLMVADWGFASESIFHTYTTGAQILAAEPAAGVDPDGCFIVQRRMSMIWPYDERGRMIGEHVFEHLVARRTWQIPAEEFITLEEAREKLMPLLVELPEVPVLDAAGAR